MSNPTEAKTRRDLIDPALKRAGWDLDDPNQVGFEIPIDDTDPAAWQALQTKLRALRDEGVPYDVQLPAGITDYALYRENGEILAVVEAKRTPIYSLLAQLVETFNPTGEDTGTRRPLFHGDNKGELPLVLDQAVRGEV